MSSNENNGVDYKKKYQNLRARYIEAIDVAYRSGFEAGMSKAQQDSIAQQMQMQAQQMQQMQGGMPPQGAGQERPPQQMQGPDEVSQAVAELESLVNKSEPSIDDLKKTINTLKDNLMHKSLSEKTKEIGLPKVYSNSYKVNLPENSKQEVAVQAKIVDDILNKWSQESSEASRDIATALGTESLTKK